MGMNLLDQMTNKLNLGSDVKGISHTHFRSSRYKGVGRPKKSDFNTKLYIFTLRNIWQMVFEEPLTKLQAIKRYLND
jgi:hypothetical protein